MRLGTIGTGTIVHEFIKAARFTEGMEFKTVYSRSQETGNAFAQEARIPHVTTSLDELYHDPDLDCIYIASPNSLHFQQAKDALLAGKHVILEKPFTGNYDRAQELAHLAQNQKLFIFEAICNIHMPHFTTIKDHLDQLGDIKLIQCNYSQYSSRYDALLRGEEPNVFSPRFSGGALADLNYYNLHFVLGLFGEPLAIDYQANRHSNGIDTSGVLILDYGSMKASLTGAKDSFSYNFGQIQGDKGFIHVPSSPSVLESVEVHTRTDKQVYNVQTAPRLSYQINVFKAAIAAKDYELRDHYLDHSLKVVKWAQKARQAIDLSFEL